MDVKGLSIQDIIDMDWRDINKLNERELRELSMRLNSAANKRLRRLEKSDMDEWSPAYSHIKKSGGDFSVKGKDTKVAIKNEIQRASDFLRSKTSTDKGTKEYRENVLDIFRSKANKKKKSTDDTKASPTTQSPVSSAEDDTKASPTTQSPVSSAEDEDVDIENMSEMQRKKLFRALDRLREKNAAKVYNIGSDLIIKELRKSQLGDKRKSRDKLVEELEKKFPELMEDSESTYVREQQDYQNRTDEDGKFRPLTAQEELDSPFIR